MKKVGTLLFFNGKWEMVRNGREVKWGKGLRGMLG